MNTDDVRAHLDRWVDYLGRYSREDGIITELDLALYLLLLLAQNLHDEPGDVAELGVYRGGPFALLTSMLRPGERAYAVDIFDLNVGPDGHATGISNSPEFFRATVRRISGAEPTCTLVRADTTVPAQAAAVPQQVGSRCRFFHVDGGHNLANIRADLRIAAACTAAHPSPIVVVDDTFSVQYPEVTDGLIEFLRQQNELVPFLLSPNKTYLCRRQDADRLVKYPLFFLKAGLHRDATTGKPYVRHLAGSPCFTLRADTPTTLQNLTLDVFARIAATPYTLPRVPEAKQ